MARVHLTAHPAAVAAACTRVPRLLCSHSPRAPAAGEPMQLVHATQRTSTACAPVDIPMHRQAYEATHPYPHTHTHAHTHTHTHARTHTHTGATYWIPCTFTTVRISPVLQQNAQHRCAVVALGSVTDGIVSELRYSRTKRHVSQSIRLCITTTSQPLKINVTVRGTHLCCKRHPSLA